MTHAAAPAATRNSRRLLFKLMRDRPCGNALSSFATESLTASFSQAKLSSQQQVQNGPEQRQQDHHDDPEDLLSRIPGAVEDQVDAVNVEHQNDQTANAISH